MTDEELERLEASARMVVERGGSGFVDGLARDMAITVLTLLERVRKAEANRQEWSDRAGEWQQNAKEYARRAEGAEAQLATIAAHIEYAGKESGLPDAVQAFVLASTETVKRVLERAMEAEERVAELAREGRKVSLNRDDAVDMLGRVRIERDDLNRKLADLERRVLCSNFEHDWAPCQPEGAGFVTECRRCPATIHTVDFRPALKP